MSKFRLDKSADIRRALQRTCDMVASGELDVKQANCIIYACQTALSIRKFEAVIAEKNDDKELHLGLDFGDYFTA